MWPKQGDQWLLVAVLYVLNATLPSVAMHNSGECYFNTKARCEYRGQVFAMGESWTTNDCYQCICMEPFGVGCCDQGSQPVDYPDWCEVVQKPDSCTVTVVMRANHKIPCLHGRRGSHQPVTGQAWKYDNDPMF